MSPFDAIVRSCAASAAGAGTAAARECCARAAPRRWTEVRRTLHEHRLLPATSRALVRHGLADVVPPAFRAAADEAHRRTALTNTLFMHALARVLRELRARGVDPVVWKGVLLADSFYPEPGMRWMGDIDLSIEADEVEPTVAAFTAAGFTAPPALATRDAIYFQNPAGVIVDVHHRVRLFEGRPTASITRTVAPRHVPAPALRVLDPDAMIAHLVSHQAGHRRDVGYRLSWVLDLAYVFDRWGETIDPERAESMMIDPRVRRLWRRLLGTLDLELGVGLPAWAGPRAAGAPALRLEEIRRQHRLVAWGLPAPRGWLRLGACRLLGRRPEGRVAPRAADLLAWPADAWRERRSAA